MSTIMFKEVPLPQGICLEGAMSILFPIFIPRLEYAFSKFFHISFVF